GQVVARLDALQQRTDPAVAGADTGPPLIDEVAPGVVRQRLEPGAETSRGPTREGRHPAVELEKDILGHVLGIGLLEPPAAAPAEDLGPVAGDELAPGGLVPRVVAQPVEQRHAGQRWIVLDHADRPTKSRDLGSTSRLPATNHNNEADEEK